MKRQLRILALTSLASSTACAVLVVACNGDDTILIAPEAGPDVVDTKPDVVVPPEDSGGSEDAGVDAQPDVVVSVPDFVAQIESATCGALTRCCFGNAEMEDGGVIDGGLYDGKTYNGGRCLAIVKGLGFEFSAVGSEAVDGGTVVVDGVKATECANKLKALTCNMTGTELQSIRSACFDAFFGKRALGEGCRESIECPKGAFCDPAVDGGICTELRGDGGSCNVYTNVNDAGDIVVDSIKNEEACSTRGSGDTGLRCNSYDPLAPPPYYRPREEWRCVPQVPNGADCNSTVWCSEGICDTRDMNGDTFDDYLCRSPVDYFAENCSAVLDP